MNSKSERVAHLIQQILLNVPQNTVFSYAGFGLEDNEILELCEALKNNNYITEINLSFNCAGKNAATALAALPNLKKLNLRGNSLGDSGVLALSYSKSLEWLDVQQNCITDTGMKYLADNSHCLIIFHEQNRFATPESNARVVAACAYNQLIRDKKLLSPSLTSAINESPEERAKYIDEHWKKYFKDPKSSIPDLGASIFIHEYFSKREEIFPVINEI